MALGELVCSHDECPPYVRVKPGLQGVGAFERVHQGVVTAVARMEDRGRELARIASRGSRYPFGQARIFRLVPRLDPAAEDGSHRLSLSDAASALRRHCANLIVESSALQLASDTSR